MSALPMNYVEVEQQSPEWMEMRKGCCTGSMVRHAIGKKKNQPKDGTTAYLQLREDYMIDIVTTRITGRMSDRYVTKAMQEGIEREADAIIAYEERFGVMVTPGGIVFHPDIEFYATSPDGLVGDNIVLEAKCPTQATHLRYINEFCEAAKSGIPYVPEEYVPQIKAHLACTGREFCHFVSWHPDFPKNLRLLVSYWPYDREMIAAQDDEVRKFLDEAAKMEKDIRGLDLRKSQV